MTTRDFRNIFIGGTAAAVLLLAGFCTATSLDSSASGNSDDTLSAQVPQQEPSPTADDAPGTDPAGTADEPSPTAEPTEEPEEPGDDCDSIIECGGGGPDDLAPQPTPTPTPGCGNPGGCGPDDLAPQPTPTPTPGCGNPGGCGPDNLAPQPTPTQTPECQGAHCDGPGGFVIPSPTPHPHPGPWLFPVVKP